MSYEKGTLVWFGHTFLLVNYPDYLPHIADIDLKGTTGYTCIDDVLTEYSDTFSYRNAALGRCDLIPLTIDTGNHPPIRQRPYRTPLVKRQIVDEQVDEMLRVRIIIPSASPWASPVTLVPKMDGSTRFCVDSRRLSAVTRKDAYPLPLIQDILDQLEGATIFTTLDLRSGYWQIPVDEHHTPRLPLSVIVVSSNGVACHLGCVMPHLSSKEQWAGSFMA